MRQRHAPALVQGSEGLPEIRLERVGDGADIPGDLRIGLPVWVRLHDGAAAVQNAVRCGVQCQADMRDACPAETGLDDAGPAADLCAVTGNVPADPDVRSGRGVDQLRQLTRERAVRRLIKRHVRQHDDDVRARGAHCRDMARGSLGGGGHFKRGKRAFLHHVGRVFRRETEHTDADAAALKQDPRLRAGDGRTIRFPAHIGAEDREGTGADAAVQKGWAAVKFVVAERHDVRFAADHGADERQAGPIVRAEGIARIQQKRSRRILRAQLCDLGGKGREADVLAGGTDAAGEIGVAKQVEDDLSHGAHPFRPPRDTPVTMLLRQKMNSRIIGTTTMVEAAIRRS